MKLTLRRAVPLAAVAAVAVGGVLLATRPWSGEEAVVQEAAASPAEFGVCNVSVSNIPPDVKVAPFLVPVLEGSPWQPGKSGQLIFLSVSIPLPEGQRPVVSPDMGKDKPVQSNALIDAQTGDLVAEGYLTPADEAKIKAVLSTLQVGPWEPVGPAWPRTDTSPTGEVIELHKPVEVLADHDKMTLRYRRPEDGSGVFGGITQGDSFSHLRAYTCDSILEVDGWTGNVLRKEVVAEEEAMFERFLDEVLTP